MKDMKDLLKMLSKRKESDMGDNEIQAKMDVLKELLEMANGKIGEDVINGLQKVTVAAKDKEGLKEGLKKAEGMMDEMPEKMMESESEEDESEEESEDESKDDEEEDEYL